jgi:hypothetical protein
MLRGASRKILTFVGKLLRPFIDRGGEKILDNSDNQSRKKFLFLFLSVFQIAKKKFLCWEKFLRMSSVSVEGEKNYFSCFETFDERALAEKLHKNKKAEPKVLSI